MGGVRIRECERLVSVWGYEDERVWRFGMGERGVRGCNDSVCVCGRVGESMEGCEGVRCA